MKAGFEARLNRDTTYFGISPNGEYDFGGGTAYATEAIPSQSGTHNISPGDPLPDTLSGFLSGSPFVYTVAIAPPNISSGEHIGPAAISRENYSAWFQDTWKVTPRFTLDLRPALGALHAHHRARAPHCRVSAPSTERSNLSSIRSPATKPTGTAFEPRVQAAWQVTNKSVRRMPAAQSW